MVINTNYMIHMKIRETTMRKRMIDIHNHSLFAVDDGAKDMEESVEMLRYAYAQGVEAVILTPHYRHGMFSYPKERIAENYEALSVEAENIGIRLYLGCEYHADSNIVDAFTTGRCATLAGGDYVLTEYSYGTEYSAMLQYTRQLLSCGYIPVIAHVERYACIQKKPKLCGELSDLGAYIQMNADSVLGIDGRQLEHVCRKLLKGGFADMIGSDAHGVHQRQSHLGQCYEYVLKKYGEADADRLFYKNAKRVLENAAD